VISGDLPSPFAEKPIKMLQIDKKMNRNRVEALKIVWQGCKTMP
jgi:hypothetical protein